MPCKGIRVTGQIHKMQSFHLEWQKAERLQAITQQVGFALWQLQMLEYVTAEYYVLVALATQGMGLDAGKKLTDTVKKNTFGKTITALSIAGKMPDDLKESYAFILAERNWLVHSSRLTSQHAVYQDKACQELLMRLKKLVEETSGLLTAVGKECEKFMSQRGVSKQDIDRYTQEILTAWQTGTTEE